MQYQTTRFVLIFLLVVGLRSATAGEKTNAAPNITIVSAEENVLVVELANTTGSTVMVDMGRIRLGPILCLHLLVKTTNGAVLTPNNATADGYWHPSYLESSILPEDYFQTFIGIPPGSSVFFNVPIERFIGRGPLTRSRPLLVSPKLVYFTTDGTRHDSIGRTFSLK